MLELDRSGYDNLWLIGGHDWHAKMMAQLGDGNAVAELSQKLSANFDRLDKKDPVMVAKWENEVLRACGMPGKPLPKVAKPIPPKAAPAPVVVAQEPPIAKED